MKAIVDEKQLCDICHKSLRSGQTFYDAATHQGPWGWMCKMCFTKHGVGLGTGKGQEYNSASCEKTQG